MLTEVVDDGNRPVPPGTYGSKVLVTVLFSETLPLIRYEMSDSIALATEPCACRRVFRTILPPQGRREDMMALPDGSGGFLRVHPIVVHRVLEPLEVRAWQVENDRGDVRLLLVGARPDLDMDGVSRDLAAALHTAGAASVRVRVERVGEIAKTAIGKAPLVRNVTRR